MAGSTGDNALLALARNNYGNEVYVILRSLLERVITFYYLQACPETEFSDYLAYSRQKTIWKMERSLEAGGKRFGWRYPDEIDLAEHPELLAAKNRFTSSKGRPITHWSPTSVQRKLERIEEKSVVDVSLLLMATACYYDDSSEALHATLYGCLFHLGVYEPGTALDSLRDIYKVHHAGLTAVFFVFTRILAQLCQYISKLTGQEEARVESRRREDEAVEIMKRALADDCGLS